LILTIYFYRENRARKSTMGFYELHNKTNDWNIANRKKQKYKLRFFADWGGDVLWTDSDDAFTTEKYGFGLIDPKDLNVSPELCKELHTLGTEYQSALDWAYPPDPSPWTEEQFKDFFARLRIAYRKLCDELKDDYDIAYLMSEKPW